MEVSYMSYQLFRVTLMNLSLKKAWTWENYKKFSFAMITPLYLAQTTGILRASRYNIMSMARRTNLCAETGSKKRKI